MRAQSLAKPGPISVDILAKPGPIGTGALPRSWTLRGPATAASARRGSGPEAFARATCIASKVAAPQSPEDVLGGAGLFEQYALADDADPEAQPQPLTHNVERTLAMLVLTAIHDIMKVKALLPTVSPEHGAFSGHAVGETIHDHDVALGYVLERCPHVLPSFAILPAAQQESGLGGVSAGGSADGVDLSRAGLG